MKIAIAVDHYTGSLGNIASVLAKGFTELGHTCDILAVGTDKVKSIGKNVRTSIFPLIKYFIKSKPDLVISMPHYLSINVILARMLSRSKSKLIVCEQNIASLELQIEHKNLRMKFVPSLMRFFYPKADKVVGVSEDVVSDLTDNIQIKNLKTTVIPNPIDSNKIKKLSHEPLTHNWLKQRKFPVILSVARLARQKRLDVLLRSFAGIQKEVPSYLMILGSGELKKNLQSLIVKLGINNRVYMPGNVENPYTFMKACDVFVLPSAWEGCSVALGEAMSLGAAVIATDGPGDSKNVVDGKNGSITPLGNVDALSSSLLNILNDSKLRKQMKINAVKRADYFDYKKICEQYLALQDSL